MVAWGSGRGAPGVRSPWAVVWSLGSGISRGSGAGGGRPRAARSRWRAWFQGAADCANDSALGQGAASSSWTAAPSKARSSSSLNFLSASVSGSSGPFFLHPFIGRRIDQTHGDGLVAPRQVVRELGVVRRASRAHGVPARRGRHLILIGLP